MHEYVICILFRHMYYKYPDRLTEVFAILSKQFIVKERPMEMP